MSAKYVRSEVLKNPIRIADLRSPSVIRKSKMRAFVFCLRSPCLLCLVWMLAGGLTTAHADNSPP
ncbi:MAG: hypothetical protein ACYTAO_14500 [Planctomycetota bacterium]|jgi:hypothetical protein